MNPTRFLIQVLTAFACLAMAAAAPARAGLIGADVSSRFYNAGAAYEPAAGFTVDGLSHAATPWFNVTVTDSRVVYQFTATGLWSSTSTNGLPVSNGNLLTFYGPKILSATLNPATNLAGLTASNVTFSGGAIAVSWAGLRFDPSTRVVLDVQTVAEPPTAALMLLGVVGVAFSRRPRRRRKLG